MEGWLVDERHNPNSRSRGTLEIYAVEENYCWTQWDGNWIEIEVWYT